MTLRFWLACSGGLILALAVWAFAPVLLFILGLTAALGLICALMIGIARSLAAWRHRR
jgi:hypothetical protein